MGQIQESGEQSVRARHHLGEDRRALLRRWQAGSQGVLMGLH